MLLEKLITKNLNSDSNLDLKVYPIFKPHIKGSLGDKTVQLIFYGFFIDEYFMLNDIYTPKEGGTQMRIGLRIDLLRTPVVDAGQTFGISAWRIDSFGYIKKSLSSNMR